jgi:hypothetical protein
LGHSRMECAAGAFAQEFEFIGVYSWLNTK